MESADSSGIDLVSRRGRSPLTARSRAAAYASRNSAAGFDKSVRHGVAFHRDTLLGFNSSRILSELERLSRDRQGGRALWTIVGLNEQTHRALPCTRRALRNGDPTHVARRGPRAS